MQDYITAPPISLRDISQQYIYPDRKNRPDRFDPAGRHWASSQEFSVSKILTLQNLVDPLFRIFERLADILSGQPGSLDFFLENILNCLPVQN